MRNEETMGAGIFSQYPELVLGISPRHGGVSPEPLGMNLSFTVGDKPENVQENRRLFFASLGINVEDVVFQKQVHSTRFLHVRSPGTNESCDALVTNTAGLYLAVSIADCLPVFIYDPRRKALAGIHAGWRGSKDRIVSIVLENMVKEFGTSPSDCAAYIGPGAGACCYEIGPDVERQFDARYSSRQDNGKTRLDLKKYNKEILLELGVPESRIEVSEHCTICRPDLYHSFRRDGAKSGRMMAVMGMRK